MNVNNCSRTRILHTNKILFVDVVPTKPKRKRTIDRIQPQKFRRFKRKPNNEMTTKNDRFELEHIYIDFGCRASLQKLSKTIFLLTFPRPLSSQSMPSSSSRSCASSRSMDKLTCVGIKFLR